MMKKINIIKATINDVDQLQQIGRQTFIETFSAQNSEADMQKYLAEDFAIPMLKKELDNEHSLFYLDELGSKIAGYLKVNFASAQTEIKDKYSLEIERIYVLKEYHGKQVGQKLFEKAKHIAVRNRLDYIWLGVWEHNPRAIRFYEKNGFEAFDTHVFQLGDDEQTDVLIG